MEKRRAILGLAAVMAIVFAAQAAEAQKPITVFAAASLQNSMKDVGAAFTKASGQPLVFNFAGSSTLARQIDEGAPADAFVSADVQWMDDVEKHGLINPATRRNLLTNHLALVAPKESPVRLKIAPWFPLLQALGGGKLAMAAPSVPAGLYGEASLRSLHVWDQVAGQVARGENVRGALNFVARGEAPLGIVYDTDAMVEPGVRIVDLFPDDSHPPIVYPAALTKGAGPGAEAFFRFLTGPEARTIFERYGFKRLP
jgi:molybdate transport system substrate-binding protein